MASNSFGKLFKFTTYGESHGAQIGCVLDGVPPGININEKDIQVDLDKRRPGSSKFVSQRKESDSIKIISGVFEGKTTGTPIALHIINEDQRPKDYENIKNIYRPSHADYTYQMKYGIRDHRGGGRSSARETAMRVAAGAVAKKILAHIMNDKVKIRGAIIQVGPIKVNRNNWDWAEINQNDFFCPDKDCVSKWKTHLEKIRKLYKNTAEKTAEIIQKHLDFPIIQPEGGLYIFMKVNTDSVEFVETILTKTGILFIPGLGFGTTGRNAVRVSFGPLVEEIDKIEQGIIKTAKYLNDTKPFLKINQK